MKIFKRPGSPNYYYKFQFQGEEYYRSTGTKNLREAEKVAAAAKTRLLRQAAGIEAPEPEKPDTPPRDRRSSHTASIPDEVQRVDCDGQGGTEGDG